jgi:1,4-dihydroxy-2-naphthoate octaprenyltransferase
VSSLDTDSIHAKTRPTTRVPPDSVRAWVLAARPATLTAAVAPVAVGTACAHAAGGFRPLPAIAALVGALLLQVTANFANDVFDSEKGADTEERLGPTRVVQSGLLSARAVRIGVMVVLLLALLDGIYLTSVAGVAVVVVGLASMASAVAYTGGPYPLGYHGLGEVFVLVFFGWVGVCGTAFVQALHVPDTAWWAAAAVGALTTTILVVNNLRDRETDARAGKRTLAVRLGRNGALAELGLLLLVAYAVPIVLLLSGHATLWVVLPLATLPLAAQVMIRATLDKGRALNHVLVRTALLTLAHGILFAVGIATGTGA